MTFCPPVTWHVGHDNSQTYGPTIQGRICLIVCNETEAHVLFISSERSKEYVSLHNSYGLCGNMTNAAVAVMFTSKCWYIHGRLLGIPSTPTFLLFIYLCMVFLMIFPLSLNIYVFLLSCLCILIVCLYTFNVPAGTLRLPWLRVFRAFSSVVRRMSG
jgi:hypothetical protein